MNAISRSIVLLVSVIVITALVPIFGCPSRGQGQTNLSMRVQALEAQVAALQDKLAYVSVVPDAVNGVNGPHLIIEGCNLHIRSGSGDTRDSSVLTGLGNLLIGYNEQPAIAQYGRLGSHNLVVGKGHEYADVGGFVAGMNNRLLGESASVNGGQNNRALGDWSSVSGGQNSSASGLSSSIFGGSGNSAEGFAATAGGGTGNLAIGFYSTVSGGTVGKTMGNYSSLSGGRGNVANGEASSVSGGKDRTAAGAEDWVGGGLSQDN